MDDTHVEQGMASARFESSEEVSESSDHQEDSEVDLDPIQVRKENLLRLMSSLSYS